MPETSLAALLKSYQEGVHRSRSLSVASNSTIMQRLVWFAVICGYVFLNARPFWAALTGKELTPSWLLLLALPWVLTAALAVLTHILMSELDLADAKHYHAKISAIETLEIKWRDTEPVSRNFQEFEQILHDTEPKLSRLVASSNRWQAKTSNWVRTTEGFLAFSFAWAIIGPAIIRCSQ